MTEIRPGDNPSELEIFDHGFVRLDASMADDLSVVNSARVSFAVRKEEMDDKDKGLIKFLMRDHHGTPFEHNSFRFHIRCPIFVAREWFRHRVGCLTGDTVVTFVDINGRASGGLSKTIDQLWKMWTQGELNGNGLTDEQEDEIKALSLEGESIRSISRLAGAGRRGVRRTLIDGTTRFRRGDWRVKKMKLRVLNEHKNEFETGHIADIIQSGVQPVYRVTLADGKSLNLTENHRVLTESGWQTLREALGLEGVGIETEMTKSAKLVTNGKPAYQDHSEPAYKDYLCRFQVSSRRGCKLSGHPVSVISCEYIGLKPTYDLTIDGPWHNFVANGIVVHNSFNEESARYHRLSDDFYVPEPEAVRSQVGKPGSYHFDPVEPELAAETIGVLRDSYAEAYDAYVKLVDKGVAKELARAVLPFGIYTQFYWTINARSLMNFIALRNAQTAQYEIRIYAQAIERFFAEEMPVTYECFQELGRTAP